VSIYAKLVEFETKSKSSMDLDIIKLCDLILPLFLTAFLPVVRLSVCLSVLCDQAIVVI